MSNLLERLAALPQVSAAHHAPDRDRRRWVVQVRRLVRTFYHDAEVEHFLDREEERDGLHVDAA